MNQQANAAAKEVAVILVKSDPTTPCLKVLATSEIAVKSGTIFAGRTFDEDTSIPLPEGGLIVGTDYAVVCASGALGMIALTSAFIGDGLLGGFHFAPGGNATARKGGDETPAINPYSVWDRNFRPACDDLRGMALVDVGSKKIWVDIYLLGKNHRDDGTSKLGVTIADGNDAPQKPAKGNYNKLDYDTAVAVMAHHGKRLLSIDEFFAAAFGVTEKSAIGGDPEVTKLDAARTSKFGIMQATGNLWVWGHDGDPEEPRASIFGGAWWYVDYAGSRYAVVGYWADYSDERLGARGRSDHLQLV